jgi:Tat protein translocase TatB subunit
MFNIGGGELLVIALVALIVLGPQRLPGAARQLGKTMSDLRKISTGFQNELKSALDEADRSQNGSGAAAPTATTPIAAAIESVSAQADRPPAKPASAKKTPAKKAGTAKKAPAKKSAGQRKAAAKTTAKRATAKKAPARKAAASRGRAR